VVEGAGGLLQRTQRLTDRDGRLPDEQPATTAAPTGLLRLHAGLVQQLVQAARVAGGQVAHAAEPRDADQQDWEARAQVRAVQQCRLDPQLLGHQLQHGQGDAEHGEAQRRAGAQQDPAADHDDRVEADQSRPRAPEERDSPRQDEGVGRQRERDRCPWRTSGTQEEQGRDDREHADPGKQRPHLRAVDREQHADGKGVRQAADGAHQPEAAEQNLVRRGSGGHRPMLATRWRVEHNF